MINKTKYKKFIKDKCTKDWFYSKVPFLMCDHKITVLCGPNGSGKSMSLRDIKEELKANKEKFISYRGTQEGIGSYWAHQNQHDGEIYRRGIQAIMSSEGEGHKDCFGIWQEQYLFPVMKSKEPCWIIFDELDSGLSPDKIWSTIGGLTRKLNEYPHLKFIITANQFEMITCLRGPDTRIIWIPTLEDWDPQTYDEFKSPYYEFIDQISKMASKSI